MKSVVRISLVLGLITSFSFSEISVSVEEDGLYKPNRIKKTIIKENEYKLKKESERNILSKKEYKEAVRKERDFERKKNEIFRKKEMEKKLKENNESKIKFKNDIQKEKRIYREVFKKKEYLKQDTPIQRIAIYYNKDKDSLYRDAILYLINDKRIGTLSDIEKILNSRDDYLSFYEAVIKTFYQGYFEVKYNKILLKQLDLIYNKSYIKIKNNYVGLLIQDLYLSMGIIHPEQPIITSVSYCNILDDKMKIFSCKMNQVQIICLSGDENMCNIYKEKMKIKYKESDQYLSKSLLLLKDVNNEKKKEFDLRQAKIKSGKIKVKK